MRNVTRLAAAAALTLLVPAALAAQQQAPPPEVQEIIQEAQQLQQQLQPIQLRALEDSALRAHQERVGETIRAAMLAADPAVGEALERFEALMAEARAAQAAGDAQRIAALSAEAQPLEPRIAAAQQQAVAQPSVQAELAAFQTAMRDRMIELDPAAGPLLERLAALEARLRAVSGG
jgi:hypothetical protein